MSDQWPRGVVAVGARVYLRLPQAADREAFDALVVASRSFLAPWEPLIRPESAREGRVDRLLRVNAEEDSRKHLVCRSSDEAILGCMNINNPVLGVFQCAMLGYWIGAPHARQGYMGEALQLALARAFVGQGLHRVEANIRPENTASVALVERAGFRLEGLSRKYLKIAGAWTDHARYALLAEEWTQSEVVRFIAR